MEVLIYLRLEQVKQVMLLIIILLFQILLQMVVFLSEQEVLMVIQMQ